MVSAHKVIISKSLENGCKEPILVELFRCFWPFSYVSHNFLPAGNEILFGRRLFWYDSRRTLYHPPGVKQTVGENG